MNIALCGYYGNRNLGDEAILEAIYSKLKKLDKDLEIFIFSDDVAYTKRCYPNVFHAGYGLSPKWLFSFSRLKGLMTSIRVLKNCDLLIIGGGGLINDVNFMRGEVLKYSITKILIAKLLGKKVLALGLGARKMTNPLAKALYKLALNKVDKITVRDNNSKQILLGIGVHKNKVETAFDLAFWLKDKTTVFVPKNTIGISLRWYPELGPFHGMKSKLFLEKMAGILDWMILTYNVNVVMIPFQLPYKKKIDDIRVLDNVRHAMVNSEKVFILRGEDRPTAILSVIRQLEFMICMRFHSVVFSIITNTPFVAINYRSKVVSLVKRIEMQGVDFEEGTDFSSILFLIKKAFESRRQTKSYLENLHFSSEKHDRNLLLIEQVI